MKFWYRQSSRPIQRTLFVGSAAGVTANDPPLSFADDTLVRLDGEGRLLAFETVPEGMKSATTQATVAWPRVFAMAGLDLAEWTPAAAGWNPPYFADAQAAWTGSLSDAASMPMRIEAAAYAGRLVSFAIVSPWTQDARRAPIGIAEAAAGNLVVLSVLAMTALTVSCVLARWNLRLGRGDRRGAARVAVLNGGLFAVSWLLNEHHVTSSGEFTLFLMCLSFGAFLMASSWFAYIALEPFVRRRWPHMLVSWTRALSGDWRDPVVGRDVLIGCAAGVALACLDRVSLVLPGWLGRPEVFPSERSIGYAFASGVSPFRLLDAVGWSIGDALMTLVVYLLLRIVLRSDRAAAVGGITMLTAATAFATLNGVVVFPVVLARAALTLVVVVRAGLLALIVAMFTAFAFLLYPMTFGFTAWYSSIGFTVLLVLVTLVVYGFLVSVQGHRLLDIESATAKMTFVSFVFFWRAAIAIMP